MSENLRLPICPKCNDTKHVETKEIKDTKLILDNIEYSCKQCKILWRSHGNTIVELKD